MSDSLFKAGFDHPCRETCSGWKQGYERGADTIQTRYSALLDASKKLAEALRQIRELTLNRFDKTGDINILANQSVASFNSFLKEQGV